MASAFVPRDEEEVRSGEDFDLQSMQCSTTTEISFQNMGLHSLPMPDIMHHTFLHFLDLSGNNLMCLPPDLFGLQNMVELNVSKNKLTHIPREIGNLKKLVRFEANHNNLTDLPPTFSECSSLRDVRLGGNRFAEVPQAVTKLPNLRRLYLGQNIITTLPKEIARLENLEILYLGGNRLAELGAFVGAMVSLTLLYLGDNNLTVLPSSMKNLRRLRTLNIHNNKFRALPQELLDLKSLEQLSLRGNPLVSNFVHDMPSEPLSLLELCGRAIKNHNLRYDQSCLPVELNQFLDSARRCTNPVCAGVYFTTRIKTVDFVDFCGKYRVPLLKFLCSTHHREPAVPLHHSSVCKNKMKRVLLTGYEESPE